MQAPDCLNCEHPLAAGKQFCSNCGQKTAVHRLSLHDVGHDALHYFTHADKGIFSLIWQLVRKPGIVAREYVAGKRRKYFPPLNFFLIVAAISLFMTSMLYNYRADMVSRQMPSSTRVSHIPPAAKASMERGIKVGKFFSKYTNIVSMAAIPLITAFVFLFFFRGPYNYTEHLVANMYIGGFTVLVYALVFLPAGTLVNGKLALMLFFLFETAYRSVAYYHFINKRTARGMVMAILANLLAGLVWITLSAFVVKLYISHGFWGLLS